ncbi:MAG TPA: SatD family protein [Geobacteraceae bacterium]|nr:SatD family protein [Geobacteraceae bacterium]
MKQKLYVMLGDVVGSSMISNRGAFQRRLLSACYSINGRFGRGLFAEFRIIKGTDEVGAVLTDIADIYDIIVSFLDETDPEFIRFALAYDVIDTGLEQSDVSRMDGPAFHRATDLINSLKVTSLLFTMETGNTPADMAFSGQIAMLLQARQAWKKRYAGVVREYRLRRNQQEVAERLGMTQQGVSRILQAVSWKQTELLENRLREQLSAFS